MNKQQLIKVIENHLEDNEVVLCKKLIEDIIDFCIDKEVRWCNCDSYKTKIKELEDKLYG